MKVSETKPSACPYCGESRSWLFLELDYVAAQSGLRYEATAPDRALTSSRGRLLFSSRPDRESALDRVLVLWVCLFGSTAHSDPVALDWRCPLHFRASPNSTIHLSVGSHSRVLQLQRSDRSHSARMSCWNRSDSTSSPDCCWRYWSRCRLAHRSIPSVCWLRRVTLLWAGACRVVRVAQNRECLWKEQVFYRLRWPFSQRSR